MSTQDTWNSDIDDFIDKLSKLSTITRFCTDNITEKHIFENIENFTEQFEDMVKKIFDNTKLKREYTISNPENDIIEIEFKIFNFKSVIKFTSNGYYKDMDIFKHYIFTVNSFYLNCEISNKELDLFAYSNKFVHNYRDMELFEFFRYLLKAVLDINFMPAKKRLF